MQKGEVPFPENEYTWEIKFGVHFRGSRSKHMPLTAGGHGEIEQELAAETIDVMDFSLVRWQVYKTFK